MNWFTGQEEWDNGNVSTQSSSGEKKQDTSTTLLVSQDGSAEITGKLCQHVMVLIQWQVGADKAVMEHMVQVLETWLRRRGISIYTDRIRV
jgi:hypothetical protein